MSLGEEYVWGVKLRLVAPGDVIEPEDHNNVKRLIPLITSNYRARLPPNLLPVVEPYLNKLSDIYRRMRWVARGDDVLSDDFNDRLEACRAILDMEAQLLPYARKGKEEVERVYRAQEMAISGLDEKRFGDWVRARDQFAIAHLLSLVDDFLDKFMASMAIDVALEPYPTYTYELPVWTRLFLKGCYNREVPISSRLFLKGCYSREPPITSRLFLKDSYSREVPISSRLFLKACYNDEVGGV